MPEIPITALHNYLQKRNAITLLSYAEIPSGPSHQQTWTIECKINGVVMGRGSGRDKQSAKTLAAQEALQLCTGAARWTVNNDPDGSALQQ